MTPDDLKYTADHEWVRSLPDGSVEIGITDFAQDALGDIVFVQLPEVGSAVGAGESCAEVESVKSVSEIYAPVAGSVVAVNEALETAPELLNSGPYGAGWLMRIVPTSSSDLDALMDAAAYTASTSSP